MMKRRLLFFLVCAFALVTGISAYLVIAKPNTNFPDKSKIIFIHESIALESWINGSESDVLLNRNTFVLTSKLKRFTKLKPGRYRFKNGMSNNAIVNMLRSGNQESLTIRTDDVEDLYALAGRLGSKLKSDSASFINTFINDSICQSLGFNPTTIACMLMPNTYEFLWTTTPADYLKKMQTEYRAFWKDDKLQKATQLGLTAEEVTILASIVKAETGKKDEAPKIAGLYVNRLRSGIPLQSDPTAVFGRQQHSSRVYLSDLRTESPYNTYLFRGLPPGPINFPETFYLDAVLNFEGHGYIYMCAQPGGTGYHNFSKTLEQHNIYRRAYTDWLERNGIR